MKNKVISLLIYSECLSTNFFIRETNIKKTKL